MKIKKIIKSKNNQYDIILENEEKIKLFEDIILKYDILIDKKIDDKKFRQIMFDNKVMQAYHESIKLLNIKMRTESEIEMLLLKKEYEKEIIDEVIKKLRKQNYINDKIYIETFINDSVNLTLNGPKKIKNSLLLKKLDEHLIDNYLEKVNSSIWSEKIKKIIEKKKRMNKDSEYVFKLKLSTYLKNQGYSSELISLNIQNIKVDNKTNIKKTAERQWQKLNKKYKGNTLVYMFKNSMLKKGFKSEEINEFLNTLI